VQKEIIKGKKEQIEYVIFKRYSELLNFHNLLFTEMNSYIRRNGFSESDFPNFPPKKILNNTSKDFLQSRIKKLNKYFQSLFAAFPLRFPYTSSLSELCSPDRLNILLVGDKMTGKSNLKQ
jgi:hypothetical protein